MDPATVFAAYVEAYNAREWSRLANYFAADVLFNGKTLSFDQFFAVQEEETRLMPGLHLDLSRSITVGGRTQLGIALPATGALSRPRWGVQASQEPVTFWKHFLCRVDGGKISELDVISNIDEIRERKPGAAPSSPPADTKRQGVAASGNPGWMYASYIACINARTMAADLPRYCHPSVTWNGRDLPLEEYRKLMEDSFDAVDGLKFDVRRLVVDEAQQMLAVRLVFNGTPVKNYAGAEPTGRSVEFAEHAFYWLKGGKIEKVQTVIDWETYKEQLTGS